MKNKYFKHTGNINTKSFIIALSIGAAAAGALGLLYGITLFKMLSFNIPDKISILLTLITGVAVGITNRVICRHLKISNISVSSGMALILGTIAVYFSWTGYILALTKWSLFTVSPTPLGKIMYYLANNPVWAETSSLVGRLETTATPSRFKLYLLWSGEFLTVVLMAWHISRSALLKFSFCLKCNDWTDTKKIIDNLEYIEKVSTLPMKLESGDFSMLANLEKSKTHDRFSTIILDSCSKCRQLNLVTLYTTQIVENKKGEPEARTKQIIDRLIISRETYNLLLRLKNQTHAA